MLALIFFLFKKLLSYQYLCLLLDLSIVQQCICPQSCDDQTQASRNVDTGIFVCIISSVCVFVCICVYSCLLSLFPSLSLFFVGKIIWENPALPWLNLREAGFCLFIPPLWKVIREISRTQNGGNSEVQELLLRLALVQVWDQLKKQQGQAPAIDLGIRCQEQMPWGVSIE